MADPVIASFGLVFLRDRHQLVYTDNVVSTEFHWP